MYNIERGKNRIKTDLHIQGDDGEITLHVDIKPAKLQKDVRLAYNALGVAQNAIQRHLPDAAEEYGKAVIALFESIFGKEQTTQLLEFYEKDYTEMLVDVYPFIQDEVITRLKDISRETKEKLIRGAKPRFSWFAK